MALSMLRFGLPIVPDVAHAQVDIIGRAAAGLVVSHGTAANAITVVARRAKRASLLTCLTGGTSSVVVSVPGAGVLGTRRWLGLGGATMESVTASLIKHQ